MIEIAGIPTLTTMFPIVMAGPHTMSKPGTIGPMLEKLSGADS